MAEATHQQSIASRLEPATGAIAIIAAGTLMQGNVVVSKPLESAGWPFVRLVGCGSGVVAVIIAVLLFASQGQSGLCCEKRQVKWVVARGTCGTLQFVFAVLAAFAGAGVGDIGALSSINTVVAAICGRLILGERLGPVSMLAVLSSVAGAVLISEPWLHFSTNVSGPPFLGYCFALLSGIFFGLVFISSRKSVGASSWLMTISAMGQRFVVSWILFLSGAVHDGDIGMVVDRPLLAVGFLIAIVVTSLVGNILTTVGGKRCPAAVSSTMMVATSMGVGYGAQVVIFHSPPTAMKLVGAGLMLLAVVMMALSRLPRAPTTLPQPTPSGPPESTLGPVDISPTSSLATFVASEYARRQMPMEELIVEHFAKSSSTARLRQTTAAADNVSGTTAKRRSLPSSWWPAPARVGVPSTAA